VQVTRQVAIGAGVAFVALIAAVAFLLGRESVRSPPPPVASAPVASAPFATAPVATAPPAPASVAPAPVRPAAAGPEATAVRDYFTRMQAIDAVDLNGDTGEYANKLLAAAMTGDPSGFDDLLKAEESGAARARAITPPAACAAYHQRLLAMLAESIAMTKGLRTAIASGDTAGLTALAASATSLQSRANALDAEATALKTKYGLNP